MERPETVFPCLHVSRNLGHISILQIVQNRREGSKVIQRVLVTLGRMDHLQAKGDIETLVRSLSRFSEKALLILLDKSHVNALAKKIGPSLILASASTLSWSMHMVMVQLKIFPVSLVPDGKWVLKTNTTLFSGRVALKYKELWQVEQVFRDIKSILETEPIFHQRDETIRGHVFCSFLALVLRKELDRRLENAGHSFEWLDIKQDLKSLQEIDLEEKGKSLTVRRECLGTCGKVFQSLCVALSLQSGRHKDFQRIGL